MRRTVSQNAILPSDRLWVALQFVARVADYYEDNHDSPTSPRNPHGGGNVGHQPLTYGSADRPLATDLSAEAVAAMRDRIHADTAAIVALVGAFQRGDHGALRAPASARVRGSTDHAYAVRDSLELRCNEFGYRVDYLSMQQDPRLLRAYGYSVEAQQVIVIDDSLSPQDTAATLAHEAAHMVQNESGVRHTAEALYHSPLAGAAHNEVVAELTSAAVLRAYGLNSAPVARPYIASREVRIPDSGAGLRVRTERAAVFAAILTTPGANDVRAYVMRFGVD